MSAENDAIRILDTHRIMAVSTQRPDGWSQTTFVGYANVGLTIYFLIFRSSQKFANMQRDDRISLAIGKEPRDISELNAVYAGARVSEITDAEARQDAWRALKERQPNLASFDLPDPSQAALMQAKCKYVSLLDYRIKPGYANSLVIDSGESPESEPGKDEWATHVVSAQS